MHTRRERGDKCRRGTLRAWSISTTPCHPRSRASGAGYRGPRRSSRAAVASGYPLSAALGRNDRYTHPSSPKPSLRRGYRGSRRTGARAFWIPARAALGGNDGTPCASTVVACLAAENPRWQARGMNLSSTLQTIARIHPDQPAISWESGQLSYAAFEAQVQHIAGALIARHGLKPGDRVALAMENCPEYFPLLYGIWRAGLAAVPLNSKLHPKEMAWILANSETKLCIASPKLADGAVLARRWALCRRSWPPARPITGRCSAAIPLAEAPATAMPRPGCSTPAAPPAGRRARCSPTATCCSPATATTPTSTISTRATPSCTPRR